jgi:MYXO-CTERM domain-containing protein
MKHLIWLSLAVAASLAVSPSRAEAAACDSNLMIALDRSCSMDNKPAGETLTKWESAEAAIATLTTTYAGQLRFGLIMFPDEDGASCDQDGPIYVDVGEDNEVAVVDAITTTNPNGPCVTNIDTAIGQVSDDLAFQALPDPTGRRGFVLLITDGKQSGSCGGNVSDPITVANIEALYAAGYPTFVVGFGGGVDPDDLNSFAVAGGVPRVGDPMYYQADSAAELDAALDAIAGDIVGDPELGGCRGTPCPDGRCFGTYEECIEGECLLNLPDAGPMPDAAGDVGADAGMGGGGGGDGDADGGCGCSVGSSSPAGGRAAVGVMALLAVALIRRRRR